MREPIQSLLRQLKANRAEDLQVAQAMAHINLLRLRWIAATVIPLVTIYIGVFWLAPIDEAVRRWSELVLRTLVLLLVWWAAVGAAVVWAHRQPTQGVFTTVLLFVTPLGSLLFTAAIASIDQMVSPNISTFIMGAIFTSLLIQMRTRTAALIHACGCAVFLVGMHYCQTDPAIRLSNATDGIAASLVSVLLSAVLWRKDARFILMQRQLRATNDELHRQQEDLKRVAAHDVLTGVWNRAELLRSAAAELRRARRRGTPTSAIMLDLDHFKRVNDADGHQAGDAVLVHVARRLADSVRTTDLVGRMGGEEFMVVLPDTGLEAALKLANKLRGTVSETPIVLPGGREVSVTASCGVSCVPGGTDKSMDWLYASADHGLYEAKRLGRDRVESAASLGSLTTSDFQRLPKA